MLNVCPSPSLRIIVICGIDFPLAVFAAPGLINNKLPALMATDGIKILPLSEVATKDDFFNIKKASQNDLLCAHRVPPQMMGIIPENSGGFGDSVKASQVFVRNELTPLQERFKELNAWFGEEVIRFTSYQLTPE